MFSKREAEIPKNGSNGATARKPSPPSILASDLHIVGNLESDGDIQIDGCVDGDIRSTHVTIGEGAVVNGAVRADQLRVAGTVNGEITAGKVELTSVAKVTGDINHDTLQIEAGAFLQGLCRRIVKSPAAEKGNGAANPAGPRAVPDDGDMKPAATILETGKPAQKSQAG